MKKRIAAKVVLLLLLSTGVRAEEDPCIMALRSAYANENIQNSNSSAYEQMQKDLCQFIEKSDWQKEAASGNLSIAGGLHKVRGAWSVDELQSLKEVFCDKGSTVKTIVDNQSRYQKTFDKYYDTAKSCADNYYKYKTAALADCGIRIDEATLKGEGADQVLSFQVWYPGGLTCREQPPRFTYPTEISDGLKCGGDLANVSRGKLIDHKFRISCKPKVADGSLRSEQGRKITYHGGIVGVFTDFGGYDAIMPVQLSKIENIHASGTLQRRDAQEGCGAGSGWKSLPQQFGIALVGTTTGEEFKPPLTLEEKSAVLIFGRENSPNVFNELGVIQPAVALPVTKIFDGRKFKFTISNVGPCSVNYQIDEE